MKPNARAQYLMADLFDSVRAAVTARQAAERYGLEFDRSGRRARCIWHSPDRHPSLTFKGSYCRCFACNNGGSSIDLVAKLFGLSPLEAARKLDADFALGLADRPLARPSGPSRAQMRREAEEWRRTRWAFLCDVEREASAVLERFPPAETSWEDPRFRGALAALGKVQIDLERLFVADVEETEAIRQEVVGRAGHSA